MRFDWDEANIAHIARHAVSPAEAEQVLSDPARVASQAYNKDGELRAAITGATVSGRMLTVIVTVRPGRGLRVVTARPARRNERKDYQGEP